MTRPLTPLLTAREFDRLREAREAGRSTLECSLDLQRSHCTVHLHADEWEWQGRRFPHPERVRERTIYHWIDGSFEAVARYRGALIKLVPTDWGPPTFEIDGIKMLPTAKESPLADARRKVDLVSPRGKAILDTCAGLGYFAACCLEDGAASILSYEKNPDVSWLRELNPWSPETAAPLRLVEGDVVAEIASLPDAAFDAVLHDPPRFGIAGELYSAGFYGELARVLRPGGLLFHYTGSANRLTTGRDLPAEVLVRLRGAGFNAERRLDGVFGVRTDRPRTRGRMPSRAP